MSALTNLFQEVGAGIVASFVSLGETADLMSGADVVANIDGGWPRFADVTQPSDGYNGHYGFITGQSHVRRSFEVGAWNVPAVAIASS